MMKIKSKLGTAALEELTQEVAADTGEEQKPDAGADGAAEGGAAEGGADAAGEVDGAAADAGADGADGAAAADAGADAGAAEGGEAGAIDGAAEGGEGGEGGEAGAAEGGADAGTAEAQSADAAVANVDAVSEDEPSVGESAEAGDTAEMISEEMAAADEAGDKAEATVDDVESLQSATESLTTTLEILQSSIQVSGLQAHGAMLLRQNLRMACESIGEASDTILLPAMEDAETPTSRIGMAGDAIDAIKKFVARIMKTIADAYKTFSDFVAKLWASLTDANKRLKARAEKLRSMVKGAEMNEMISSKRLITAMAFGSEVPDNYVEAAKTMNAAARDLCDAATYSDYLSALQAIENGTKAEKNEAEIAAEANKHLERLTAKLNVVTKRVILIGGHDDGRSLGAMKSSGNNVRILNMPGNRSVVLWVPDKVENLGGFAGSSTTQLSSGSVSAESVKALDEKQASALCDDVIATCDFLINNGSKSVTAFNAEIKKHSDAIMTRVEAAIDASRKNSTSIPEAVRKVSTWVQKAMYSLPQLPCTKVARALPGSNAILLDVVAASMKRQGAGEAGAGAVAA